MMDVKLHAFPLAAGGGNKVCRQGPPRVIYKSLSVSPAVPVISLNSTVSRRIRQTRPRVKQLKVCLLASIITFKILYCSVCFLGV